MREEIELMRVVRVPPMGKLVIEINGNRYENLSDISDERLKRRVITAVGEMMGLAGGYQALVDADVAPPLANQTPSGKLQQKAAALKEQQDRFLDRLEQEKDRLSATVNKTPVNIPEPTITPDSSVQPPTLVEQIDEVLQRHVVRNAEFNGRSIHLVQGPEGNVQIEVDGEKFNRPKDIADKNIQIMIKKAIKEWEAS